MLIAPQRILFLLAAIMTVVEIVWARIGHFNLESGPYLAVAAYAGVFCAGAIYYQAVRKEAHLSAMFIGIAFLAVFSNCFSVLNAFLLTVAGHRIDTILAAADRALGVDWHALMGFAADHPVFDRLLKMVYNLVIIEIMVLVVWLGCARRGDEIYRMCFAILFGATITIGFWTFFPSFGPYTIYSLNHSVEMRLDVMANSAYEHRLLYLLAHGPGRISIDQIQGLVAFPSFHTALALFATWYARSLRALRWPVLALNGLVLISIPIQGGHYVVDVLGGALVVALSILLANCAMRLMPMSSATAGNAGKMAAIAQPVGI